MAPSFTTQTSDFNNHNMMASHDSFTYADDGMMNHTYVDGSNTAWEMDKEAARAKALAESDMERWAMEMSNNVDEITYNRTVTPQAEATATYGGFMMVNVPWMAPGQIVTVTMGGVSSEHQVMSVDQTQDGTTLNVNIWLQPVAQQVNVTFDLALLDPPQDVKDSYARQYAGGFPTAYASAESPWIPSTEELEADLQSLCNSLQDTPTDLDGGTPGTPLLPQVFGNHVVPPKMYDPLESFNKAVMDELVGSQNEAIIGEINKQWWDSRNASPNITSASQDMATKPRPKYGWHG